MEIVISEQLRFRKVGGSKAIIIPSQYFKQGKLDANKAYTAVLIEVEQQTTPTENIEGIEQGQV